MEIEARVSHFGAHPTTVLHPCGLEMDNSLKRYTGNLGSPPVAPSGCAGISRNSASWKGIGWTQGLKVPKLWVQISLPPDNLDSFTIMEKPANPSAQSLALDTNTLTDFNTQL